MEDDSLTCEGSEVKTADVTLNEDDEFTTPALEIRKGMLCNLRFHVFNYGESAVVLKTATVKGVGLGARAGVRAVELSPVGAKPRQDEADPLAAVFSLDSYRLEAGADEEFSVVLEYGPGCTPPSDIISFTNSPTVITEDGEEVSVSGPAYAFVGAGDGNCSQ